MITIVADQWCPINCEPNSDKPGYVVEVAQRIFNAVGHDVIYQKVPWKRAISGTQKGQYTAIIGATVNQENSGLILPQEHFCTLENDYYVQAGNTWVYQGPDSLKGKTLGIINGYFYGNIQSYIDTGTIKTEKMTGDTALLLNLKKLIGGRFFALVDWGPVVDNLAQQQGLSKEIVHAGRGGNTTPLYLGFGSAHQDYADIWDKGLKDLKSHGLLEPILQKYGLSSEMCGLE